MSRAIFTNDGIQILDGSVTIPVEYLLNKSYLAEDDIVLVSGTLIEGMGNIHSDLDIYVICNKRPDINDHDIGEHVAITNKADELITPQTGGQIFSTYDYFGDDGLHIDIKYITKDEIRTIFDDIHREFHARTEETNIFYVMYDSYLSYEALKLIHRLGVGMALVGEAEWLSMLEDFPNKEFRFNLFHQFIIDYFIFKDIQGAYISGNLELAVQISRNVLHSQILGLTFLCGNTNSTEKWIFHYVREFLDDEYGLARDFIKLWFQGAEDDSSKQDYVRTAIGLIDRIFDRVRIVLRDQYGEELVSQLLNAIDTGASKRGQSDHLLSQEAILLRKKNFIDGLPSVLSLVDKF